jgi:hypothetical protein
MSLERIPKNPHLLHQKQKIERNISMAVLACVVLRSDLDAVTIKNTQKSNIFTWLLSDFSI